MQVRLLKLLRLARLKRLLAKYEDQLIAGLSRTGTEVLISKRPC